jgi:hypothetical protein
MSIVFAGLLFIAAMGTLPEIAVAQTVTPTATITATVPADDWEFPTEPLLPYQYDAEPEAGTIDAPITSGVLWEIARIALTAYNVISGGDGAVWLLFVGILLLPMAGLIVYRLLTDPPEI